MTQPTVRRFDEHAVPGRPLGRHVYHDPRSRAYAVTALDTQLLANKLWKRLTPIYDQGNLGSCTGNALAGSLSTEPFRHRFREPTAVTIYRRATRIDGIDGQYPPDDTGSTGLAVAKYAQTRHWISRYDHAFSINAALTALMNGPVITGVTWFDSFDEPDSSGRVVISPNAQIRGGHEVCVVGVDVAARTVRVANSWSNGWGDGGYFVLDWSTWEQLLADYGDVTVPVL